MVNLTGAGVGDQRWTAAYKRGAPGQPGRHHRPRWPRTIAALPPADRPRALLNASGIGCYGDTGDRDGRRGRARRATGFLRRPVPGLGGGRPPRPRTPASGWCCCAPAWRCDRDGGLLKPQLLPFRLGVGGKLGSGRQWVPWIALADWLSAVEFLLARDDIAGPVNVVGPEPVTNAEFTKALGRALHRPTVMPIPAVALKVLLGGFAVEVLHGSGALPGVLHRSRFHVPLSRSRRRATAALGIDQTFSQAS